MKERGNNGQGSIEQRKNGRWVGRIRLPGGKRPSVSGATEAEVVAKLEELKRQAALCPKSIGNKESLGAFIERWLRDDVAMNKAPKTYEEYENVTRLHVVPFVGHHKLAKLNGEQLVAWQADLKRKGRSDNTRSKAIRVLRKCLNDARKLQLIPFNPMDAVTKPKVRRRQGRTMEAADCPAVHDEAKKYRLGGVVTFAMMTGLRIGEVLALQWEDLNLFEGIITVRRSLTEVSKKTAKAVGLDSTKSFKDPKTKRSRRVVTLENLAADVLRKRQEAAEAEGFDKTEVPHVFPNTRGNVCSRSNFNRLVWNPIRETLGIKGEFRFHDLRHTQASLMLHVGGDMKVIQERLGHASITTTIDLYGHLMQDAQAEASDRLGALFASSQP